MRTMTFCVGLVGLLLIAGCQNRELLECQEKNAGLVTQAADLQKITKKHNESTQELFIVIMKESQKSQDKIKVLTQENKTQREKFQQTNTKQQAELEALQAKISASAKLLGEIRQQLQRIMLENAQLKERISQLAVNSASEGDGN